eukprot:3769884-Amphidinium_carterae.1
MNSQGEKRAKWIQSIERKLASFKNNHVTEVINQELKEKCRQVGNYPLPTQMVFVDKPDMEAEVKNTKGTHVPAIKHKSRMVICGNRQPWEADERTSTHNLDASLLRWM